MSKNENPLQGSFIIEELTDLVEAAVLEEFERINDRGGVLGAMETQYQRGKIQEESMEYEVRKHSGALPIIGVNTFLNPNPKSEDELNNMQLARATKEEKDLQIKNLRDFQAPQSRSGNRTGKIKANRGFRRQYFRRAYGNRQSRKSRPNHQHPLPNWRAIQKKYVNRKAEATA